MFIPREVSVAYAILVLARERSYWLVCLVNETVQLLSFTIIKFTAHVLKFTVFKKILYFLHGLLLRVWL